MSAPQFELTDENCLTYINSLDLPAINEWMRVQFGRGLDYYRDRIRRLGLRGHNVLDAGCGVGVWSIALTEQFREVHALEIDRERLSVLAGLVRHSAAPIVPGDGSITELPYPDNYFDCVFCNGVIFVAPYPAALAEFARVLKPNGQLYLSFVGIDWWLHLVRERAAKDPVCLVYGSNGLINLLFRRLTELRFEERVGGQVRARASALISHAAPGDLKDGDRLLSTGIEQIRSGLAPERVMAIEQETARLARDILSAGVADYRSGARAAQAALCIDEIYNKSEAPYRRRVTADLLSRMALGQPDYSIEIDTYSFEPEDMSDLVLDFGFHSVFVAPEGRLQIDFAAPPVRPLYERWHGVYELLACAPVTGLGGDEIAWDRRTLPQERVPESFDGTRQ